MRRGAFEQDGQNSSSQRQSPNTYRCHDQLRVPDESDPNPTDSDDENTDRDRGRDDRGRDDRGKDDRRRDRNRDCKEPHRCDAYRHGTGGGRRDPSSDLSDPDDDDIYGR